MDATQHIENSFFEEEEDTDEENEHRKRKKGREPLAALKVFKNNYIPEMEVPLYLGENVLGRDPTSCPVPLEARSISSRHAIISISVFHAKDKGPQMTEALLWDLGSLNGTRKGRIKLTPHVRYALAEGDSVVLADLPCQYVGMKSAERKVDMDPEEREKTDANESAPNGSISQQMERGAVKGGKKVLLPPVPLWSDEEKRRLQSPQTTPKQPERTLVPESDSDSEGEKSGRRERRNFVASDSASSDLSSPTCSTFLTPANKVIPESEDESAITPSSLTRRLIKTEDHSIASSESPRPAPLAFNVDSDTDVEENETDKSKCEQEVEATTSPPAAPVSPATGHMESKKKIEDTEMEKFKSEPESAAVSAQQDSDTDVEENEPIRTESAPPSGTKVGLEKKPEPLGPAGSSTRAEFHMDSITDAEDDGEPTNMENSKLQRPDARPQMENIAEFHMNSDTDAEDGIDQTNTETRPPTDNIAELHMNSDTDEEGEDAPMTAAASASKLETSDAKPSTKPGAEFHMDSDTNVKDAVKSTEAIKLLSDSETDDEDPFRPTHAHKPTETSKAPETKVLMSHSDSDTDVEDNVVQVPNPQTSTEVPTATENNSCADGAGPSCVIPPKEGDLADFRLDSDTDVEEEEEALEERKEKGAEKEAGMLKCSTPRESDFSEEEMETQAFLSPSQLFKHPAPVSLRSSSVSPGHISPDSDDFVVAETQSFVSDVTLNETRLSLEAQGPRPSHQGSFQLGLSDSSLQQETQPQALGVTEEEDWDLQPTQLYAERNLEDKAGSSSARNKRLDLEATQAYTAELNQEEEQHEPEEEEEKVLDDLTNTNLSTADTELIRVQEAEENVNTSGETGETGGRVGGRGREEEEEELVDSHLSTAETVIIIRSPKGEEQAQPCSDLTAQTPLLEEEEREMAQEEELMGKTGCDKRTKSDAHVAFAETQPTELEEVGEEQRQAIDSDVVSHVAVAETLPIYEDEEGQEEEQEQEQPRPIFPPTETNRKVAETLPIDEDFMEESAVTPSDAHAAVAETLPLAEDEEGHQEERGNDETRPGTRPQRVRLIDKVNTTQTLELSADTNITTAETQPVCSDPKSRRRGRREEDDRTQPVDADPDERTAVAAVTQPVWEDEEESVEELGSKVRRHGRPRKARVTEEEQQTQPVQPEVAVAQTLPLCEGQEGSDEKSTSETKSRRRTRKGKLEKAREEKDHTQPVGPDAEDQKTVAAAVSQPVCDGDKGQQKEEQNKNGTCSRPRRGRQAEKKETIVADADVQVTVAERQPVRVDDEGQEEGDQSKISTSSRPRRGKLVDKEQTQPTGPDADIQVTGAETLSLKEDEDRPEEELQTETTSSRRSRSLRMMDKEQKQPIDSPPTVAETLSIDGKSVAGSDRGEASGRGLRGRGRGRGASGRGRGKTPVEREGRRKRGRTESDEEAEAEEEADKVRKGTGRKSMRQKVVRKEKEEREEEETRLTERGQEDPELRKHLKRPKGEKKEREEREETEKNEAEMTERMERDKKNELEAEEERKRIERERKEREDIEKKEQEENDRLERERMEREKEEHLEKEKKEREERERQEEKLEKERRELEERARLEQEKKEREEKERLAKEVRENEERDKEEKEQSERRQKEREPEEKEEQEGVEMRRKGGRGKQRASTAKRGKQTDKEEEEKTEVRSGRRDNAESSRQEHGKVLREKDKGECEAGTSKEKEKAENEGKPKRGRRPTRKLTAPSGDAEANEDVPAKRTRSRSNSSNSVSSERSTPSQEDKSRGRGRGRKTEEEVDGSRTVGRRRTTTASSSKQEDTKQGGRGRKSLKIEEVAMENPYAEATGRGRRKGAQHPKGSGDVKVEDTVDDQQTTEESERMSTSDGSVISQASSRGRKRGAAVTGAVAESPPPTPKTPRRSLASHSHKVLFTGVTDDDLDRVVVRLGGSLASGVGDMTHLVTDKVRRTVKFLCAVARGVPIVTMDWLTKSGKAGSFLSPSEYLVKDVEQERKFKFSLQESLSAASHQPLLQGYEIHVTPSVKPEPSHMKDIITCCGARYLPKMPATQKPQTVVVSCEEDWALCERVLSLSLPVVSAEFLLTGILQQKVDPKTHKLSISPSTASKPTARGRKK